jgi:hypothetical protein
MMVAILGAVNSFLLSSGLDVFHKAAQLHDALRLTLSR